MAKTTKRGRGRPRKNKMKLPGRLVVRKNSSTALYPIEDAVYHRDSSMANYGKVIATASRIAVKQAFFVPKADMHTSNMESYGNSARYFLKKDLKTQDLRFAIRVVTTKGSEGVRIYRLENK